MGAFVLLIKDYEDDTVVIYKYRPNAEVMGKIQLNKKTRMLSELESINNPDHSYQFYFDRAAQRLARCLIKEGGVFLDRLTFES